MAELMGEVSGDEDSETYDAYSEPVDLSSANATPPAPGPSLKKKPSYTHKLLLLL